MNYLFSDVERPAEYVKALKSLRLLPKLSSYIQPLNVQKDKRQSISALQVLFELAFLDNFLIEISITITINAITMQRNLNPWRIIIIMLPQHIDLME